MNCLISISIYLGVRSNLTEFSNRYLSKNTQVRFRPFQFHTYCLDLNGLTHQNLIKKRLFKRTTRILLYIHITYESMMHR